MKVPNLQLNLNIDPVVVFIESNKNHDAVKKSIEMSLNQESDAVLPDGNKLSIPLKDIFDSCISQDEDKIKISLLFNMDKAEKYAVKWCHLLSEIPPQKLPKSQRMGANLLKKLPLEATGNAMVDRGRKIVINNTLSGMAPSLKQKMLWSLNRELEKASLI